MLMYTGGTTGLPKGVLSNQRGQMMNLYHCLIELPYERGETFLLQTPMFHAGIHAHDDRRCPSSAATS